MRPLHSPAGGLPADEATLARQRRAVALGCGAVLGLGAILAAVKLETLETRYLGAIIVGTAGLVTLPLLGSRQRARDLMVVAMCLGLSVGFSISFLHRTMLPGRFVPFMGGAQAVTVSLTFVATAMYAVIRLFERGFYRSRERWRLHAPLVWPAVLFMAAGLLSLANAADAQLSLLEEFRLLCLLAVTVVAMNFNRRELEIYLWVLGASVILQAGLAGVQYGAGRSLGLGVFGEAAPIQSKIDFEAVARPTGTIGDPNILSYFFEITAPCMLALTLAARGRIERAFFLAATAASLLGALVTLSRAAWVAIPLALGFVLVKVRGRRLLSLRTAAIAIGLLGAVAVASVYLLPVIERRLFSDDAGSTAQRMPLNRAALYIVEQFPLLGVGLNNFAITFTSYDATGASRVLKGVDYVVHNMFLLVWTETGTVGLAAFLWYFGSVFLAGHRLSGADARTRAIGLAIPAGFAAHLLHGMVDPGFMLNLTVSQLIAAQVGIMGWLALRHADSRAPPIVA